MVQHLYLDPRLPSPSPPIALHQPIWSLQLALSHWGVSFIASISTFSGTGAELLPIIFLKNFFFLFPNKIVWRNQCSCSSHFDIRLQWPFLMHVINVILSDLEEVLLPQWDNRAMCPPAWIKERNSLKLNLVKCRLDAKPLGKVLNPSSTYHFPLTSEWILELPLAIPYTWFY